MNVMQAYTAAREALFAHVGFTPDWVEYAIDDCTSMFWGTDGQTVIYAETLERFQSDGEFYRNEIYTQRFYDKHIYEGAEFTLVFCDPHTDGCKWFRIFANQNRQEYNDNHY